MIKLLDSNLVDENEYYVTVFADTKDEITNATSYPGLPSGATLSAGSMALTASFEVALLKSDGTWSWKE